jgi:ESF2/ABP1 family protein
MTSQAKRQRDDYEEDLGSGAEAVEGVLDGIEIQASLEAGPSRPSKAIRKPIKKSKTTSSPGIIYISRLPPGMTPPKVRHLMSRWGEVGKVYAQRRDG